MRYRLVCDDSGHTYAVPTADHYYWPSNDSEFETFEIPNDAIRIDGNFTFLDPRCD